MYKWRESSPRDNDADQPLTETHAGGTLAGLSMTWTYDNRLRLATATGLNGISPLQAATYGYDNASRLQSVTDGTNSATYAYHASSSLISALTLTNSGSAGLVATRTYDKLGRLTGISSKAYGTAAPSLPLSFLYQYNAANQRTRATLADGGSWSYQYDALGQVVSGKRAWTDGTPVAGQQFEYRFDEIGNRTTTGAGGDASGGSLRLASYTTTALNQYTNRTVPAAVEVLGLANPVATVTVNGDPNAYRRGEYFRKELSIDNASAAQWTAVTANAAFGPTNQSTGGYVFLPKTPEVFVHDTDGNLLSEGRWTNRWDGENRLIELVSLTNAPTGSKRWLQSKYDHQGRRILKTVCWWTNSAWSVILSNKYLYDGWNLVAELNATNNAVLRSYVWGNDLSGSLDGAGGVGGLLLLSESGSRLFAAYDGNGNVAGLTSASDGSVAARYEYGPFAEPLRVTGVKAKANPIRFSTKYTDDESDWLYYGYRYYNPATGRWLNRDPIGERGGVNLYGFVRNCPQSLIDPLGTDINLPPGGSPLTPWPYFCDPCGSGPVFGPATKTLRDWRWHVWGRTWQPQRITIHYPGIDKPIVIIDPPWPWSENGYWVIAGGWVVVDATCKIPKNSSPVLGWTLMDFIVTDWPSIAPNMKPTVMCKYTCGKKSILLPGDSAMPGPPPLQREDDTDKDMPPPILW